MRPNLKLVMRAAALAACLSGGLVQAAVVTYSTKASFLTAATGLGTQHLSNFDSSPVGTAYADGTGPAGSGFTMTSTTFDPTRTPSVQNSFWTTSGANYLGLDNSDAQFSNGDTLSFALIGSVRAFGLYVIAATNDIVAGDLSVSVGATSLSNLAADLTDTASGSSAFFFGFVSDVDITSVALNFGVPGDPTFFFAAGVDDVMVFDKADVGPGPGPGTVPEPSSLALLGVAGLALTAAQRRRRRNAAACALLGGLSAAPALAGDEPYVGEIICGAWNFAPRGTLDAAGQILPISQNTALFSLLGTTFGGNGVNNFQLPDLRGRAMVGVGQGPGLSNYDLGQVSGSEAVTLFINQMPAHSHLVAPRGSTADATLASPAAAVPASKARTSYFAAATAGAAMAPVQSDSAGGSQPISTMQPYVAITCTIATQGVFPPRQ